MNNFVKQNSEPILIEHVIDEHDENKDFYPSFCFNNRRYYLEDFISVNTPFVGLYYDIPDYIHGVESENYINPLFVEILSDEFINIYIEE